MNWRMLLVGVTVAGTFGATAWFDGTGPVVAQVIDPGKLDDLLGELPVTTTRPDAAPPTSQPVGPVTLFERDEMRDFRRELVPPTREADGFVFQVPGASGFVKPLRTRGMLDPALRGNRLTWWGRAPAGPRRWLDCEIAGPGLLRVRLPEGATEQEKKLAASITVEVCCPAEQVVYLCAMTPTSRHEVKVGFDEEGKPHSARQEFTVEHAWPEVLTVRHGEQAVRPGEKIRIQCGEKLFCEFDLRREEQELKVVVSTNVAAEIQKLAPASAGPRVPGPQDNRRIAQLNQEYAILATVLRSERDPSKQADLKRQMADNRAKVEELKTGKPPAERSRQLDDLILQAEQKLAEAQPVRLLDPAGRVLAEFTLKFTCPEDHGTIGPR